MVTPIELAAGENMSDLAASNSWTWSSRLRSIPRLLGREASLATGRGPPDNRALRAEPPRPVWSSTREAQTSLPDSGRDPRRTVRPWGPRARLGPGRRWRPDP